MPGLPLGGPVFLDEPLGVRPGAPDGTLATGASTDAERDELLGGTTDPDTWVLLSAAMETLWEGVATGDSAGDWEVTSAFNTS